MNTAKLNAPSRKLFTKEMYVDIVCGLYFGLFMYTALDKIFIHQTLFYNSLRDVFKITWLAGTISYGAPLLEIIISLLLVIPKHRKLGLWLATGLMLAFTIYIITILSVLERKDLPCHCGGVIRLMTWTQHIYFNTGFILLSALALFSLRKKKV